MGELAAQAQAAPKKTAIHLSEQRITYGQRQRAAAGFSARLSAGGVRAGDVVLLLGRNSVEAAVALLGCFHRGAVAAPVPPMFGRLSR